MIKLRWLCACFIYHKNYDKKATVLLLICWSWKKVWMINDANSDKFRGKALMSIKYLTRPYENVYVSILSCVFFFSSQSGEKKIAKCSTVSLKQTQASLEQILDSVARFVIRGSWHFWKILPLFSAFLPNWKTKYFIVIKEQRKFTNWRFE